MKKMKTHLTKFEKIRTIGAITSVILQIVAVTLQILIALHVGLL